MIIYILVARLPSALLEAPWVVGAVDEWTVENNELAMPDTVAEARRRCGKDAELRWLRVDLPCDALDLPFRDPEVKGEFCDGC